MSSPCYGCPTRIENCHSMCQRYAQYKLELDIQRGTVKQRSEGYIDVLTINRRWKAASERKRKRRWEGWTE